MDGHRSRAWIATAVTLDAWPTGRRRRTRQRSSTIRLQAMIRFGRSAPVQLPSRRDGSAEVTGRPAGIDLCLEVEEVRPGRGCRWSGRRGRASPLQQRVVRATDDRAADRALESPPRSDGGRALAPGRRPSALHDKPTAAASRRVGRGPGAAAGSGHHRSDRRAGHRAIPTPSPCSARPSRSPTGSWKLGPTSWRASCGTGEWAPT